MSISGLSKILRFATKTQSLPLWNKLPSGTRQICSSILLRKQDNSSGRTFETRFDPKSQVVYCMLRYGFNEESAQNLITICPQIETLNPEKLSYTLSAWFHCQFGGENLVKLLTTHPQLLLAHHSRVEDIFIYLSSHFQKKQVYSIFITSPLVITENRDRLSERLEYLAKEMVVSNSEIAKSGALAHPLDYIKLRHEFLKRAGVYKKRKSKDVQQPNPKLDVVLNTSNNEFSTKVAGLTAYEFEIFNQILKADEDNYY